MGEVIRIRLDVMFTFFWGELKDVEGFVRKYSDEIRAIDCDVDKYRLSYLFNTQWKGRELSGQEEEREESEDLINELVEALRDVSAAYADHINIEAVRRVLEELEGEQ